MRNADGDLLLRALTRRQAIQRLGAGGALLSLPGLLAACGDDGSPDQGARPGTPAAGTSDAEIELLTWAMGGAVPTLDTATGAVAQAITVQRLGLEGLVALGSDLTIEPALAESFDQPDARTHVYTIRSGVKFWDGTPLTEDDVVYSLKRHLDPEVASQIGTYYGSVRSIEATGDGTVTIRLKQPDRIFPYALAFSWITPRVFSEKLGKKLGASGSTISTMGTGAYRFVEFDPDNGAKLERNPDYWGGQPAAKAIDVQIITDPRTRKLAVQSGEVDGTFDTPLDAVDEWERIPETEVAYSAGLRTIWLAFDMEVEPWNDVHVRRAVAHAVDQEALTRAFVGRAGQPATVSIVPPAQWGSLASPEEVEAIYAGLPQYPYDIEQANAELAQSAHPDGFNARIQYPSDKVEYGKALISIGESLKDLGVTLDVESVTPSKWLADIYAHNQPIYAMTLGTDAPDPSNFVALVYPSKFATKNAFNLANFKNDEVDRLIEEQEIETDAARRVEMLTDVLRISAEELPYLPIWYQATPLTLNERYVLESFTALFYMQNWGTQVKVRA